MLTPTLAGVAGVAMLEGVPSLTEHRRAKKPLEADVAKEILEEVVDVGGSQRAGARDVALKRLDGRAVRRGSSSD